MFYSFSLNQPQISCDKICHNIQKLIEQYKEANNSLEDAVVTIRINTIINSQENTGPLRLEYISKDTNDDK